MQKTILVIDQHEMDVSLDISDREGYYHRKAVRAVLSDGAGRVALMHARQRNYYKLPGGGVDEGESLVDALDRELMEEVGAKATVTEMLGEVVEFRDFVKMKQTSYAFSASLNGEPSAPSPTQSEVDEGFEVKWVDGLGEAIKLVESKVNHDDIEVVFMSKRDAAILRAAR